MAKDGPVPEEFDRSEQAQVKKQVITVALKRFSRKPYSDAKLESIARNSGVPKSAILKHFGDKKNLYHSTLAEAVRRLQPPAEALTIDSAIPVDGVRQVVEAIFQRFVDEPDCLRMVQMENLQRVLKLPELAPLINQSEVILQLDKLLMVGQDAGAFRPGISAYDVYFLITSIASFRVTGREMTINLFDIDLTDRSNTPGMRRMVVDTVLAFLTSNIPDSSHQSYLTGFKEDADPIYQA